MSGLSDGDLDRIAEEARQYSGLDTEADVVALVGEVRRLRAGIAAHRETIGAGLAPADLTLWDLLADQEDSP